MIATAWTCGVCGEADHNREEWTRCIVCNYPRGAKLCERCARVAKPAATTCLVCGGALPPDPGG